MTCKCDRITARNLSELVTLRKRTLTAGSFGARTEAVEDHPEWAMIKPLGGREAFDQMRMRPLDGFTITIRFRGDGNQNPFYTVDNRVIVRTRELAIESVVDIEDAHRWLELRCVANKAT